MSFQPGATAGASYTAVGTLVAYAEVTASVTVSGTNEATATLAVTAPSFVADGTSTYWIDFYCPQILAANSDFIIVVIYADGAFLHRLCVWAEVTNVSGSDFGRRRVTPSAGAHVYDIRAFRGATNGTLSFGTGASGVLVPGFIAITKAT